MDVLSFVVFSFTRRYMLRWIVAGMIFLVPGLDFLSLGYLWRTSGLSMIGGVGLPTWERKGELWWEGARLTYIIVLYEALPSFLFSLGFLLSNFPTFITHFVGRLMIFCAAIAFLLCSYLLPFAFCAFVESMEVKKAFDFERVAGAMMEVFAPYTVGYLLSIVCLYVIYELHRIPIMGICIIILWPILTFYVLLVATYYFTQLFRKTRLSSGALP